MVKIGWLRELVLACSVTRKKKIGQRRRDQLEEEREDQGRGFRREFEAHQEAISRQAASRTAGPPAKNLGARKETRLVKREG